MRTRSIIAVLLVVSVMSFVLPWAAFAEWVCVDRVIDGDTFITSDGTRVRIRDIDTPETRHPTRGKEPGGEVATRLARFFLQGNYVWLEGRDKDRYGRRLATVKLPSGTSYAQIVRSYGYDRKSNSTYSYSRGITWVNGYYRRDGTWVSGHWRRKPSSSSYTVPSYFSSSSRSGIGPVRVRGYFRRDGTWVRPHYRSKPKR